VVSLLRQTSCMTCHSAAEMRVSVIIPSSNDYERGHNATSVVICQVSV
jgi:hypothetical protein